MLQKLGKHAGASKGACGINVMVHKSKRNVTQEYALLYNLGHCLH